MASDKREFVNFRDFQGFINIDTGYYEFPVLYSSSSTGKTRQWAVYVRLIKKASKNQEATKEQNWNLMEENQILIKDVYLDDDSKLPDGILAQVWTEAGQVGGKISRSAPTYTDIKNKGKKNERNVFHQALVVARGKYLKKSQEGYKKFEEYEQLNSFTKKENKGVMYFPMLARIFSDFENKIEYPVYVQPKLDGVRCIAYLRPPNVKTKKGATWRDVILYSRQKKEYPNNNSNDMIRRALYPTLYANFDDDLQESLYLDGEIYKHGKSLQKINSESRTTESKTATDEYHIYDMFYPSFETEGFDERNAFLNELYDNLNKQEKQNIKLVKTHLVKTRDACDKVYNEYITKGYEGIMIRTTRGPYAKSAINKSSALRSKDLLKRKEIFTEEFEVVGFTGGVMGKDVGALIWVCKTTNGQNFNVTPNATYEERYKLYKDCIKNFQNKYANRMMIIEFRGLSEDKVPQHAKAIWFRDNE